jgi:hypothetical protein
MYEAWANWSGPPPSAAGPFPRIIKLSICDEHGSDPASVHFCETVGLNYVSCSPHRVSIPPSYLAWNAIRNAHDPNGAKVAPRPRFRHFRFQRRRTRPNIHRWTRTPVGSAKQYRYPAFTIRNNDAVAPDQGYAILSRCVT